MQLPTPRCRDRAATHIVPHNRKVIAFGFDREQAAKLALRLAGEASK